MRAIEQAIQNRADASYIAVEDLITVGEVRDLLDVIKALSQANALLALKLGVEDHVKVAVPIKKPQGYQL